MLRCFAFMLVLSSCCLSLTLGAARAQTGLEHALQAGDWPAAARQAEAALSAGGVKPERWVQLQLSLGVAYAHLGESEAALRAFVSALALDPDLRLPPEEVVEVRSPFMEARGFWSQHPVRLGAVATLSEADSTLQISLIDPAALVSRVVLHARVAGQTELKERVLPSAPSLSVPLDVPAAHPGVDYTIALIDENANRLWELGGQVEPQRESQADAGAPPVAPDRKEPKSPRPYYIGAAVSLVVAAGSLAVAAVSHVQREQLAQRWNDAECDGEGSTRGEVCAQEHDRLDRYQRMAIGFYAVAGAGLVAGIAALVAAPRPERASGTQRALRWGSGPGLVGVSCAGRF